MKRTIDARQLDVSVHAMRLFVVALFWALLLSGPTLAQGDAEAGKSKAAICKACHSFGEGAVNKLGPVLNDVVGRAAGVYPGFSYSEAMLEAGSEGLIWTPETLDAWLTKPKALVPGTKMNFGGVASETDRGNLIAYLISLSPDYVPAEVPAEAAAGAPPQ